MHLVFAVLNEMSFRNIATFGKTYTYKSIDIIEENF